MRTPTHLHYFWGVIFPVSCHHLACHEPPLLAKALPQASNPRSSSWLSTDNNINRFNPFLCCRGGAVPQYYTKHQGDCCLSIETNFSAEAVGGHYFLPGGSSGHPNSTPVKGSISGCLLLVTRRASLRQLLQRMTWCLASVYHQSDNLFPLC